MAYTKYSLTPANNTAAPPDGAPEGMLPSAVNDTMRDMMAQIRDVGDGVRDGTYTMTAPKITGGTITGVTLTGNTLTNPVITGATLTTSAFNGTVGATTASTGAFTTLSTSSTTTFSGLTASTALALDASKNVVSVTNTGTGSNVLSASPTLTGTIAGASLSLSSLTSGRVTFAGASGLLSDSSTFVYDASGNLGLGISTLATGIAQRTLQITNGTNGMILLGSGATQNPNPRIFGGDTYDLNFAAGVTTGKMIFYTNDTERMRIPAAGGVQAKTTISVGDATPSSSGAGVTFPATQSASSDANTLDDYEEGTWTAVLTGSTAAPSTEQTGAGVYTKIGRVVSVHFRFNASNTTGATGSIRVTGFPFTFNAGTEAEGACTMSGFGAAPAVVFGISSQTYAEIYNCVTLGAISMSAGTDKYLYASLTYYV